MEKNNTKCNHKYVVGYSFRMPNMLINEIKCDNCKVDIRLTLPWRIMCWLVDIGSFFVAYYALSNVQIELFGSRFLPSILIASLLVLILQQLKRPILRFGKWINIK